jgi:hypothetical protein
MIPTIVTKYSRITEKEIVAINRELKFKPSISIIGEDYPFKSIGLYSGNFSFHLFILGVVYYLDGTVMEWIS